MERRAQGFLLGGGEMGELIRSMDWTATPLGPFESWPQSLRSAVSILLPSKAQIALFWGEELITLYNDAYRPVFGAKHPGALGKPIREAWDELWRAGLEEIFAGVLATGEAFWAKDRPFFMERHGYLEETYFDVSYDPVRDESGKVGGVFCIVSETTGRVIGERRLRALRDLGNLAHHAHTVAQVHASAAEVLARFPEDIPFALLYEAPASGATARLVARVGLEPGSPAAPDELPAASEAVWPLSENVAVLSEKQLHPFGVLRAGAWPEPVRQVAVVPLAAKGQEPAGHFIAGISPRRRLDDDYLDFLRLVAANIASALSNARKAEDERRRLEMLAELDRAKTAFFSNVSHEFRTPLTLMLGPVDELLSRSDGELARDCRGQLAVVQRNGQRLLKLVNTLLDFARIEAGRMQASFEPTDLAALTAELASNFRSACDRAGIRLRVDCPALGEAAWVDHAMWEKIVLNLVSNAFKFTFEGEIAVRLRETAERFELQVRDTGTGIPAEALPRIFERFYRVEGAHGRSHEGSGIGLALVHELVKQHSGSIDVESAPGRGTTFTVSIPKGTGHLPADRLQAPRHLASTAVYAGAYVNEALSWLPQTQRIDVQAPKRTAGRVLLADDNADLREYAHRLLAEHYDVKAVEDGEAALAVARSWRPDVIVSDVMMPRLDGFGLIQAVRADSALRTTPIVLLSARAGEEARMEGLSAGADAYVVKPFTARELLVRVGALLHTAEIRRQAFEQQQRVTEQVREQLEELEALLDALPVGVFIARDAACTKIVANDTGYAMLRISKGDNASKTGPDGGALPFRIIKNGIEMASEDLPMQRAARLGTPVVGEEVELVFQDGDIATFYEYAVPLFDPTGRVRGCLGLFVDITERKKIEQALRESEERLKDADRRKDEFLAMLAHELRNPLAPIANALQLMRNDRSIDPVQRQARAIIERQVARLARLIDDLLEVSRITSGRIQLQPERVAIGGIIERAIETVRPLIEQRRHTLSVSLPAEPIFVHADVARLEQVVVNLLNNAAKYTNDGGRIQLHAALEGEQVVVRVVDNGIGIEPELLPQVFELFTQAERSLDRSSGGLGIGLSLVQRLVHMHGGTVDVKSTVGQGSEFIVRLPVTDSPVQSDVAVAAHDADRKIRRMRVLVVDDNLDAAESLTMLLESSGHIVRMAHDGFAAIEAAVEHRPHVALLDIGLPGLDGYEVARRLRADASLSRMTLVALTGYGQSVDREKSRAAGFDRHLTKPADFPVVEAILADVSRGLGA